MQNHSMPLNPKTQCNFLIGAFLQRYFVIFVQPFLFEYIVLQYCIRGVNNDQILKQSRQAEGEIVCFLSTGKVYCL